jgi:chromosome segregation ATPase
VAALLNEGFPDLRRRLRLLRLGVARSRIQRKLYGAETELGWLGWEQVDFFDEETAAQVKKVQEYENTQATLQNAGAELSGKKYAVEEELAQLQKTHGDTQQALAEERAGYAAQLDQMEATRAMKLTAVQRFDRAVEELDDHTADLDARAKALMRIVEHNITIRIEEREIGDEIKRIAMERKMVLADKANAQKEASDLEASIAQFRAEVHRIDLSSSEARDKFEETRHKLTGETRVLDREKEKSSLKMANLDKEKQKPYRYIGACLADHNIAPRNQPQILARVVALRKEDAAIGRELRELNAASAAAKPGLLAAFYGILAAVLLAVIAVLIHFI